LQPVPIFFDNFEFPSKFRKIDREIQLAQNSHFHEEMGKYFPTTNSRKRNNIPCDCVMMREKVKDVAEACAEWLARRKRPAQWENIKRDMTIYGNVTQSFSSTVAAAAEANVHFSFPFSFSYLNFRLFLVGFSIDVDSPRSFLRWFVRLIVGRLHSNREKKEPKEKPIKRPIIPMLSID
jgi:hypothetical protein